VPFNLSSSSLNKTAAMSTPIPFGRSSAAFLAASPPSSSGVHYSTLLSDEATEGSLLGTKLESA